MIRSGASAWQCVAPWRKIYYVMPLLYVPKCVCVCARMATCTARWVHVPQWCCLATVWRSVCVFFFSFFCFESQIMTLDRMCFPPEELHPFTLKRGTRREESPLSSLSLSTPPFLCGGSKQGELFNPVPPQDNKRASHRLQRLCMYFSFTSLNSSISCLRTKLS